QDLWTQWIMPELPPEKIRPIAVHLNQLWRETAGQRIFYPETWEVLTELFRRGYRLGIISNTISSVEVPKAIKEMELTGCIETVFLSCEVGLRKPDPAIFHEAAKRLDIQPERCDYIGNLIDRDVIPSRQAGFAGVGLRLDSENPLDRTTDDQPDFYFEDLRELLERYPPRKSDGEPKTTYQVSLSTMWGIKNTPHLSDFFEAARRMGFESIELNHGVDSEMLAGIGLSNYQFSSVHEPCPADISTRELIARDWLISSPDEEKRIKGVAAIRRSIDLACRLNASSIVIHCGTIQSITENEIGLRELYTAGKRGTEQYKEEKQKFIEQRENLIAPHLIAVKKSLKELMEYAAQFNIRLGIENRYHYYDIPQMEEMEELLALGDADQLGFIYDIGHAETLDQLGFYPHEEWLRRYAFHIIGIHIHDVNGIIDHYAPGLGQVDYEMIASYLPEEAYRAFEVRGWNTYQQVKGALNLLTDQNLINIKGV
ncbi:MAG TPA: TIM barrel protein, partial [Anaerolineales bacterium]|nr:TIM barrel protein [Anaerolineales bacterium]